VRCAGEWVGRYRVEGEAGLADRSSAPRRVENRTAPDRVAVIVALRRLRMTAAEIAETLLMPRSGQTASSSWTQTAAVHALSRSRQVRLGLPPDRLATSSLRRACAR
jgi:leucine-zipper of insertion element IS481